LPEPISWRARDLTEVKDAICVGPILRYGETEGARGKEFTVIDDLELTRALHVLLAAVAIAIVGVIAGSRGGLFS